MQTYVLAVLFAAVVGTAPAVGQTMGHDHGSMMQSKPNATSVKSVTAEGEVRRVDPAKGTVVLKHGPLDALGMGPMTMEFRATDPKILANVKQGDKVRFVPAQGKNGELLVTSIEIVKG